MRKIQKSKPKQNNSPLTKNLYGTVISNSIGILILFILSLIVSVVMLKSEKESNGYIMYFYFCSVIASFINGYIASKKCEFKGFISGAVTSVSYNFLVTIILLFVSKGKIRPDIGILYAVTTIFSTTGGIFGANTKRRK